MFLITFNSFDNNICLRFINAIVTSSEPVTINWRFGEKVTFLKIFLLILLNFLISLISFTFIIFTVMSSDALQRYFPSSGNKKELMKYLCNLCNFLIFFLYLKSINLIVQSYKYISSYLPSWKRNFINSVPLKKF